LSVVEYSASVWDPYKQYQKLQVEQIQRRAAEYVFNDYRDRSPCTVSKKINSLQWDNLESMRTKMRLTVLYRIN